MNEERNQAAAAQELSEILQVRRDKLAALQEAGRTDVIVTGVDANEQAVAMIQAGNTALVATVRQDFVGMAKIVTEEMIKVFNGEETTRGDFYAEAVIVDK